MMQAPRFATHIPLRRGHGVDQRPWVLGAERAEAQPLSEALPAVISSPVPYGALRHGAKVLSRSAATGRANDAVVGRHQARLLEVKQPRQQFAPREVSERAEQDNDVGVRDCGVAWGHATSMASGPLRRRRWRPLHQLLRPGARSTWWLPMNVPTRS